jgi:hypothetical protein
MDDLATTGIILDRSYAYRFCSPSRSALNTGRNSIHVNTGNDQLTLVNLKDSVSGFAGIPRNMTCIGNKLTEAGYMTGQAGKWHLVSFRFRHTVLPPMTIYDLHLLLFLPLFLHRDSQLLLTPRLVGAIRNP